MSKLRDLLNGVYWQWKIARFFTHLLLGLFFYWAVSKAVVTVQETYSTENYIGVLCMGLYLFVGLTMWTSCGLLNAQPNAMLAWNTPITGPILYRRLLKSRSISLAWIFLVVPAAAMFGAARGSGLQPAAMLLGILGYIAIFAGTYAAVTQGMRWYCALANPALLLITGLISIVPIKFWKATFLALFFGPMVLVFALDYLGLNPMPSIDLCILDMGTSLHSVPVIGSAISYVWCPFIEFALLFSDATTPVKTVAGIATVQLILIALQLPLLSKTLTANEPLWRKTSELSDFTNGVGGDNFIVETGEHFSAAALVDAYPGPTRASRPSPQNSGQNTKNGKWALLILYAFFVLNFSMAGSDKSFAEKYTFLVLSALVYWGLFAILLRTPIDLSNAWWPIDRGVLLRRCAVGWWWELPLAVILMISTSVFGTLPPEHLIYLVPGFVILRVGLVVALICGAHPRLGRSLSGWIQIGAWFLSITGLLVFGMQYAIHGWNLSRQDLRVRILIEIALSLFPIAAATGFTIWRERKHTGRQYYTPLRN